VNTSPPFGSEINRDWPAAIDQIALHAGEEQAALIYKQRLAMQATRVFMRELGIETVQIEGLVYNPDHEDEDDIEAQLPLSKKEILLKRAFPIYIKATSQPIEHHNDSFVIEDELAVDINLPLLLLGIRRARPRYNHKGALLSEHTGIARVKDDPHKINFGISGSHSWSELATNLYVEMLTELADVCGVVLKSQFSAREWTLNPLSLLGQAKFK